MALLFFQYNSTIITTTIITTIADSVRTVFVTVIQASAFYYDVITYDVIKLLPPLEQGLPPCCPPCKMNLVTPLPVSMNEISESNRLFESSKHAFIQNTMRFFVRKVTQATKQ